MCLFPFPSAHHLVDDPSTPSGHRLAFGPDALPATDAGLPLDPKHWNALDGFSVNSQLLFWFEDGTDEGLIGWDAPAAYAAPDARTVIVDLHTGERVPHFAELDHSARDPRQRAYVLRPLVPLEHERHYAVGVRGLRTAQGAEVRPSPAFQILRDGLPTSDPDLVSRRERFEDLVFPGLQAAGLPRDALQLAWDFRTGSREGSVGRMVWMRDDALAAVGPQGPAYAIAGVETADCGQEDVLVGRTVELLATAPRYTQQDGPGALLTRDADGQPYRDGESTFAVTVRIPCSVLAAGQPAPVLQIGHGLLGSRDEVRSPWLDQLADPAGWALAATDWTGMAREDLGAILSMITEDPSDFAIIPERTMQGFVHQLLVLPLLRGPARLDPALTLDGAPLLATQPAGFYGNSQGAILGGALLALSQDLDRGVLGVSGTNFGFTLTRSRDFGVFLFLFQQQLADDRDVALLVQGLVQQVWDPGEGAGYLGAMNRDPLPGTPPKQVLIHTALGDGQVSPLGGQIQARAYGAHLVAPAARPVFGLVEQAPGFVGSALVEWTYADTDPTPVHNVPPTGPDPHECPRREPDGMQQIRTFLRTGVVEQPCAGVCGSTVATTCP